MTFGPSDTEMFVTVPIFNDDVLEMTESFFGILTNAVGMNVMIVEPTAVVNITEDDREFPTVVFLLGVKTVTND